MRNLTVIGLAIASSVVLAGCGGGSSALKGGELKQSLEAPTESSDYVMARGIGAADPALPTMAQRKQTSRNAARNDALYQLVGKIKGFQVEGGITVEKAMETDSKITASVNNLLQGAEEVSCEWDKEDGCIMLMRLPKKIVEKNLGVKF